MKWAAELYHRSLTYPNVSYFYKQSSAYRSERGIDGLGRYLNRGIGGKYDLIRQIPPTGLPRLSLNIEKGRRFGGPRTSHKLATGMEGAGFELLDTIMWLYGSGFPKAYNVANGIEGKLRTGSANWNEWKNLGGDSYDQKSGYLKLQADQGSTGGKCQ